MSCALGARHVMHGDRAKHRQNSRCTRKKSVQMLVKQNARKMHVDLPLPLDVDAGVTRVEAVLATAVLFVDANVLLSPHRASAVAVFLCDADVLAVAVVATGRAGLVGRRLLFLTFPSSALDRDTLVRLDLGGLSSLLVLV